MTNSKLSVYLQIVEDVKRKIQLGLIADGERLPSCRDFAIERGINPNTVQRAYSTLEEQGYIYTVPKKGVYARANAEENSALVIAREKIEELKKAGITRRQLEELIKEIYEA